MPYKIKEYTYFKARQLGVIVRSSKNIDKKIDIFDLDGNYITSVGAYGYADYPTYLEYEEKGKVPKGTAKLRREAYKKRHVYRKDIYTNAWWADQLLW